jgi:phage shock protein E
MSRKRSSAKRSSPPPSRKHALRTSRKKLTWLWAGLGILAVVVIAILTLGHKNPASAANSPTRTAALVEIQPTQASAAHDQGALLLDVRTQEEWDQYHIKDAVLIPLEQLQERLGEIPRDRDIVVVCRSGHRAQTGATLLLENGFSKISYLGGGMNAWVAAGFPVEGTPP